MTRRFLPPWSVDHPSSRRVCSIRISSAMLVRDRRTSSANGAFGRHARQAQVDRVRGAASRTADPQEPIARGDGGADRRREQHRHSLGMARVPGSDQAAASWRISARVRSVSGGASRTLTVKGGSFSTKHWQRALSSSFEDNATVRVPSHQC
jgi:hypothetical protein